MQTPIQHDGEDDEYVPLATAGGAGAIPYTPGEMSEISDLDFSPVAPVGRKKAGNGGAQQTQPAQPPGPPAYNPYAYMQQGSLAYSMSSQGGAPPPGWNDSGYGSYYFHQPPPPSMMMYPQGGSQSGKPAMPNDIDIDHLLGEEKYSVYNARWIMLFYMSMLNLLSDWTCYSVAPIAILTIEAFGEVDPESLVTVFLGANAVASAAEPAILGRLGLRRTVLFGAALLMIGSIIKSGGSPDDDEDMTWRLYFGFFLVGLSQPLYQCTPALLSASWFPENERTMATGVALNSNQLGIGCAFVFGTILVETKDDIIPYFGLLSVIATIMFIGAALQFDDAPPTPPSDTARVIKGDLVFKIPNLPFFGGDKKESESKKDESMDKLITKVAKEEKGGELSAVNAAPSPASTNEPVAKKFDDMTEEEKEAAVQAFMMQGGGQPMPPPPPGQYPPMPMHYPPVYYGLPPPASYQQGQMQQSSTVPTFYHGYDAEGHYHNALLEADGNDLHEFEEDAGAEPILTQLDHHLDIDIRDDQIVQQFKACFARKGFAHCIVAFTTSGIIVNTLSTFMDYLVTLNGADKSYVGIVGGTFQLFIMFASLVFGGWTDHSRKYYFVILAMLILGAFALALCNTDLDANAGGALRWHLLIVAILAGPLQPLSTELGVEVVYPLSENTVLVIQQLFSNLLSAAFIPVFKALKDVGTVHDKNEMFEVPVFTFSFYMLIIIHACSTMYFATFNGTYLRYEAEEEKKAAKEAKRERILAEIQQTGSYGAVDETEN